MDKKEYIIRREGIAGSYGLGEVVSPGVTLFKAGFYGLTEDELKAKLVGRVVQLSEAA